MTTTTTTKTTIPIDFIAFFVFSFYGFIARLRFAWFTLRNVYISTFSDRISNKSSFDKWEKVLSQLESNTSRLIYDHWLEREKKNAAQNQWNIVLLSFVDCSRFFLFFLSLFCSLQMFLHENSTMTCIDFMPFCNFISFLLHKVKKHMKSSNTRRKCISNRFCHVLY